ncbi:hypothetical protein KHA80_06340 [Anaerobacillus sp. HL2]|nr:hypothetical protein KHA80_06340 [Anaerobacillus sp. HL2]
MHPVRSDFSPGILAGIVTCPNCKRKMLKNTSTTSYKSKTAQLAITNESSLHVFLVASILNI